MEKEQMPVRENAIMHKWFVDDKALATCWMPFLEKKKEKKKSY